MTSSSSYGTIDNESLVLSKDDARPSPLFKDGTSYHGSSLCTTDETTVILKNGDEGVDFDGNMILGTTGDAGTQADHKDRRGPTARRMMFGAAAMGMMLVTVAFAGFMRGGEVKSDSFFTASKLNKMKMSWADPPPLPDGTECVLGGGELHRFSDEQAWCANCENSYYLDLEVPSNYDPYNPYRPSYSHLSTSGSAHSTDGGKTWYCGPPEDKWDPSIKKCIAPYARCFDCKNLCCSQEERYRENRCS